MKDGLGRRVWRGLAAAIIGSVIAGILSAALKSSGADDLMLPVAIALIIASLAYWAWTKRDEA